MTAKGPSDEESFEVDLEATRVQTVGPSSFTEVARTGSGTPQRLGRYTIKELIGKGGMAEVFLATQDGPAGFEKTCVLKRIRRSLAEEQRFVDMFLREARIAARLNHPNVVQIFELGEVGDGPIKDYFIAMEFLDGLSLYRAARRSWAANESVPMEVALRATADAALGLHHAHTLTLGGKPAALVHRDVSPDNVILTRDGIAKVLDFGIAKSLDVGDMTGTGEVKGKIPFMSPEQLQGHTLDGRSDLWSLGVTLYWLLTGKRPFDGANEPMTIDNILRKEPEPPRAKNPLVPPSVDVLVMELLQKDPLKRLANGALLADRLLAMLGPSASYSAAAAFLERVNRLPDPTGPATISALTLIAARPESQWLKRLDSEMPEFMRLSPQPTPTGRMKLAQPSREPDVPPPPTPVAPVPPTNETFTGLHTNAFLPSRKPWAIVAGAVAAVVVGVGGYQVVRPSQPSPPATSSEAAVQQPAPPVAALAVPVVESPVVPAPVVAAPVDAAAVDAAAVDAAPVPAARPAARRDDRISVKATAPARIQWRVNGKTVGTGNTTLKLPVGTTRVTAVDPGTGGVTSLAVDGNAVAFAQAKSGTLVVRAKPWAEVSLGPKALGTTPLDPIALPEGRYELTFTRDGKTKKQTVDVKAGATANANVDMR